MLVTPFQLRAAVHHEACFSGLLDRLPQHLVLPPTEEEEEESAAARFYKVRHANGPQRLG
jgi:hypothetical protein